MSKIELKKLSLNLLILMMVFLIDRLTKFYILKLAEDDNLVDIYLTSYLNLYLIWNKGIAFGLFSFDDNTIYNLITLIITIITSVILVMIVKAKSFEKYCLMLIFGGSIGNLFDRIYYSAVPDFIDFHVNNYHWFIFNVADIFITLGVLCLIYAEIFFNNGKNEKFI
jgi:signal peptidase II